MNSLNDLKAAAAQFRDATADSKRSLVESVVSAIKRKTLRLKSSEILECTQSAAALVRVAGYAYGELRGRGPSLSRATEALDVETRYLEEAAGDDARTAWPLVFAGRSYLAALSREGASWKPAMERVKRAAHVCAHLRGSDGEAATQLFRKLDGYIAGKMADERHHALALDRWNLTHVRAIDLALSGGGYRAALFHLGVLGYLHERQLLKRVRTICSVSGGSIAAAHALANWPAYTTHGYSFREAATRLAHSMITTDLTGEALKQSALRLLQFRPFASETLVEGYDRLLGTAGLRWDDKRLAAPSPELFILATHLTTGSAFAFSRDGVTVLEPTHPLRNRGHSEGWRKLAESLPIYHEPIAHAVAASSAFPPVFAPLQLRHASSTHAVTDGGAYDNSGVKFLMHLYKQRSWTGDSGRLPILVDAGRTLPIMNSDGAHESIVALALRVSSVIGHRLAAADGDAAETFFKGLNIRTARVSIHDSVSNSSVCPPSHSRRVQELVSEIRTELDPFSPAEIFALYRHGFLTAQESIRSAVGDETDRLRPEWSPVDEDYEPVSGGNRVIKRASGYARMSNEELEDQLRNSHLNRKEALLRRRAIAAAAAAGFALCGLGFALAWLLLA